MREVRLTWSSENLESSEFGSEFDTEFQFEVGNPCNHRCNFCWHWSYDMLDDKAQSDGWDEWVKERLDLQIFKDTIDGLVELGDCEEIQIGGGGEPLLHPNIHEMIGYVKENNLFTMRW